MSLSGLSEREARASRQKCGFNEQTIETSFGKKLIGGLTSLSCKLFIIAAMIRIVALLLGLLEVTEAVSDISGIFIFTGLAFLCALFEALVSYLSEKRMYEAFVSARQSEYTILRGSKTESAEEKMLTVGDIVYLSGGDAVPADGIVADGQFVVDQSELGMLEKMEKTTPPTTFHGNKAMGLKSPYSLYKGSVITEGGGAIKITATGDNTLIAERNKKTIEIHGDKFSLLTRAGVIAAVACAVAVLVFCSVYGGISGQLSSGIVEGVSAAAAILAVICLCGKNLIVEAVAASVIKGLGKSCVNISKPDVLNNMRDVKVIFTEKTGAFTEGNYVVNGFIDGMGNQVKKLDDVDERVIALIKTAAVNTSSAQLENDGNIYGGTPADRAILNFVKKAPGKAKIKKYAVAEKDGINAVTVNLDSNLATFFSGSAENILKKCADSFSADGKKRKITNKEALVKLAETISLAGNDVIALAVCDRVIKDGFLPSGKYTLIGMIVLHDKVYDTAGEALERLEKRGVKTVLLTSSSRETVIYTMKKTGKKNKGVILSSEQLSSISDDELGRRLPEIRAIVNARMEDKIRVVRIAQEQGIKACVIGSVCSEQNMINETDVAIASPVCMSAIRSISDASSNECGLTAAAELYSGTIRFVNTCRILLSAKLFCSILLAVMTVISVIRW